MSQPDVEPEILPGRPVRLVPVAPGLWQTLLGAALAALAPLIGFLIGVTAPRPTGDVMFDPIYWGLFGGIVVGAVGVATAVLGGIRLHRHHRAAQESGETQEES